LLFPKESIKSKNVEKSGKYLTTITKGEQEKSFTAESRENAEKNEKKSITKGLIA
jgi:hypothetical protein